jgi:hypothetical protein
MEDETHALYLRDEIVTNEVQHDLDKLGIAKTAREEKIRARNERIKNEAAHDARMAQLYREVVLKEKPATSNEAGFIPLAAIAPTNGNGHSNGNGAAEHFEEVEEPVAGD